MHRLKVSYLVKYKPAWSYLLISKIPFPPEHTRFCSRLNRIEGDTAFFFTRAYLMNILLKLLQNRKTHCIQSITLIFILIVMVNYLKSRGLTLILLTWRIWWAPNNASKWHMGFNSAFKGLTPQCRLRYPIITFSSPHADGLGTLYGLRCLNFTVNMKLLRPAAQ